MIRIVIACLLCAVSLHAQTRISGVVNIYTPVLAIPTTCSQDIVVEQPYGFKPGDRVIIIQMKGAGIATTDSPQFGDITSLASCGNLEFGGVKAVNGNVITLNARLVNTYDVTASVQLVRVAGYVDVTITGTVRAQPWNGRTGGIVAIEASGTVTFNADINVSGVGFVGGIRSLNYASCSRTGYVYTMASGYGAQKGEGVAQWTIPLEAGRGKLANGGGGGVDHNSGGGGGGNAGAGGRGGDQWVGCGRTTTNGAVGGIAMPYARTLPKIYLGGGGGGGHQNNGTGTSGASGGGIVILRATSIDGANRSITATGASVTAIGGNDAAGGGGGGGAIWIDCAQFTTPLRAVVTGGAGGSVNTSPAHGVGGGGGGGIVLSPLAARSPLLQLQLQGGSSGYNIPFRTSADSTLNAAPGNPGSFIERFNIPEGAFSLLPIVVNAAPDTTVCKETVVRFTARAVGGTGNYVFMWRSLNGQIVDFGTVINYRVSAPTRLIVRVTDDAGCLGEDTVQVELLRSPRLTIDTVDVGSISSCNVWRDTSLLLRNLDTIAAQITAITPQSPSITMPGLPALPLTIPVGGTYRIPIHMKTTPNGAFIIPIVVSATSCDTSLTTFIKGTSVALAATLTPDSVVLAPSPSCVDVDILKVLTFTNRSSVDVTIPTIISSGQLSTIGPTFPRVVQAGATLSITVHFTPSFAEQTGALRVPWGAAGCMDTLVTEFKSNIQRSQWTVSDTLLDFGHVLECDAQRDTSIVVRNVGVDSMTFTMIPRGPLSYSNVVVPTFTLGPDESVTIPFEIHPISVGVHVGELKIVAFPCNDTVVVALRITVDSVRFIIPDTVAFGTILTCKERARVLTIPIANRSTDGVMGRVESVRVPPPFAWNVRVGDSVSTLADILATITFEPLLDGDYADSIVLDLGPCTQRNVIYVTGRRESVALEGTPVLAFPTRSIGDTNVLRAFYTNTGRRTLTVASVQEPTQPFSLAAIQPPLPAVLQPGDTLTVDVKGASIPGTFTSQLRVVSDDPCDLSVSTVLSIEAFGRTTVRVPRLRGAIGAIVRIPVLLDAIEGVQDSLLKTFQCTVQFDKHVLAPMVEGGKVGVRTETAYSDSTASVTCSGAWDGTDTLAIIPCTVLLAVENNIPLLLSDDLPFAWGEVPTDVIQIDGEFEVEDICAGRDLRIVKVLGGLQRIIVSPNPVRDVLHLAYSSTGAGVATIQVMDAVGRLVQSNTITLEQGSHVVPIAVDQLAAGAYFATLHAGTTDVSVSFVIIR